MLKVYENPQFFKKYKETFSAITHFAGDPLELLQGPQGVPRPHFENLCPKVHPAEMPPATKCEWSLCTAVTLERNWTSTLLPVRSVPLW